MVLGSSPNAPIKGTNMATRKTIENAQKAIKAVCAVEQTLESIHSYGKKLANLGNALQDEETDLRELVALAYECGLKLHIYLKEIKS